MSLAFDTLKYTKGAVDVGIVREHAEYQAEQMFKLVDEQLVTKSYLSNELKSLEVSIIKWMVGISFSQAFLVIGILGFIMKH